MSTITLAIILMAGTGLVLGVVIGIFAKLFRVESDPRVDLVTELLPGANCGGCGFAGCRAFADAAVKAPDLDSMYCPVGGDNVMKKVAGILGYEVKAHAPRVAVVRCNGSCANRPKTNVYDGVQSCKVKAALYSGDTGCAYGCLGCGDCVEACQFGAISMDPETGLPIVDESKCTACGACVKACPKGIIELRNKGPRSMRVFVSCVNQDKGGVARKACSAACIGCGKCAKVCPHGAITVENNLAYIDFTKCKLCKKCVAECPTGAIHAVNFPVLLAKPAAPKPAVAPKPAPSAESAPKPAGQTDKSEKKEAANE